MLAPDLVCASTVLTDVTILQAVEAWLINSIDSVVKYGHIRTWNTSLVTDMTSLFDVDVNEASGDFNEDLSGWDTSRVTTMQYMFYGASSFNGDVALWDTSRVTDMYGMFWGATAFNGNLAVWDTSRVTDMSWMFYRASSFKQTLCWNTLSVLTGNMYDMFAYSDGALLSYPSCTGSAAIMTDDTIHHVIVAWFENATDVTLTYGPIRTWNTSLVTDMTSLFDVDVNEASGDFNEDLSGWDTSRVTTMQYMFYGASSFNGNVSSWDTSNVTSMNSMFFNASTFNGNLRYWDTSKVKDLSWMFSDASNFNCNLSTWNTSRVTNMQAMFEDASSFNGEVLSWNTQSVTDMSFMYNGATIFNSDISLWNTSKLTNMKATFQNAIAFNSDLSSWDTSKVKDMCGVFFNATSFSSDLSLWNTSRAQNMNLMFCYASSFNSDITSWDTSRVSNMSFMFNGASSFKQRLCWNHSIADTKNMFEGSNGSSFYSTQYPTCLTAQYSVITDTIIRDAVRAWLENATAAIKMYGHIRTWNTSLVTDMEFLFDSYYNVDSIRFNENLSGWDTSRVTNMKFLFYGASSFNSNISSWITSRVINMTAMFYNAASFNGDVSSWDTSNVRDMNSLFYNASSFNSDLSSWNTSRVTNMSAMFIGATSFKQRLCWNSSKAITDNAFDLIPGPFYASPYPICLRSTIKNPALTNFEIQDAIYAWLSNSTDATVMYGPISNWNTSLVTDMESLFDIDLNAKNIYFNEDLSRWDTSQVTNMNLLFFGAKAFNGNVSSWITSRVVNMTAMFCNASSFNCDLSSWDTSKVMGMQYMFFEASSFNSVLSSWDTSRVTDMNTMFYNALSFNQSLCWNTTIVIDRRDMFQYGSNARLLSYPECSITRSPSKRPSFRPTSRPSAMPTFRDWPPKWNIQFSMFYGDYTNSKFNMGYKTCPEGSKVKSISAVATDWIHQFSAKCDDTYQTILGPWGDPLDNVDLKSVSCPEGFNGWNVSHGPYINRMSFACTSIYGTPIGPGVSVTSTNQTVARNQHIIGFQVYYESSGIHAIRIDVRIYSSWNNINRRSKLITS